MVRTWVRQALRASGVAILVPAAVVAALALSALGGGGGVASLSQVLDGPAVPPAEAPAAPAARPRRDERLRIQRSAAAATRTAPGGGTPTRSAAPQPGGAGGHVITAPGQTPHRPARPPASPPPATGSPPAPTPAPGPQPIHDAGTQVAQTVRPLPVVGPVAADAVQAVVDLIDPPV